jgi:hypothetical protein
MPQVNGRTLMMAIQAVDEKMNALQAQIDRAGEDDDPTDAEDLLLTYQQAADDLRAAYENARAETSNLPPYARLVRDGGT